MRQVEERYTPQELREYEASKIAYRDIKNSVDTAKREGIAEGMEKGMEKKSLEIAKKMLTKGMDEATVMEITGLSAEMIQQLKAEMLIIDTQGSCNKTKSCTYCYKLIFTQ